MKILKEINITPEDMNLHQQLTMLHGLLHTLANYNQPLLIRTMAEDTGSDKAIATVMSHLLLMPIDEARKLVEGILEQTPVIGRRTIAFQTDKFRTVGDLDGSFTKYTGYEIPEVCQLLGLDPDLNLTYPVIWVKGAFLELPDAKVIVVGCRQRPYKSYTSLETIDVPTKDDE